MTTPKTIRLTNRVDRPTEADRRGATVELPFGALDRPRPTLSSPGRAAPLLARVPAASLPGAEVPGRSPRRRPVAPPVSGPLVLLVVDTERDARPLQDALHTLGLRTLVRQGGLEALHSVTDSPPDLILLGAWQGPVDSRAFVRTCRTIAPELLPRMVGLVRPDREVEATLLSDEGVGRFVPREDLAEHLPPHLSELGVEPERQGLDLALAQTRPTSLLPGEVVASRFVVEERLGTGATASVYRVRDDLLGGHVALKLLEPSADPHAGIRFRREMQIARQLVHPNLVRCFDFGLHRHRLYYTMELVEGCSLRERIDRGDLPSAPQAFELLARLLDAMGTLHSAGVLHRDIKPGNVFVDDKGGIRLGDFGAARLADDSVEISATGFVIGTPGYLPPERLLDDAPDSVAGDVFGAGVLAFELLTGRRPWPFDSLPDLLMRLARGPAPRPSLYMLGLPDEADRVVSAMVERSPQDRPTDCFALSRAFRRCALLLG